MVTCSMGPGDFDMFLNPYKKPQWLYEGPGDFDIFSKPYKKA
jgi:hypothetical protein